MATPDYLQQVIVSGRRRGGGRANSSRRKAFQRPSVASLVFATLDMLTVLVAAVVSLGVRVDGHLQHGTGSSVLMELLHETPRVYFLYVVLFGLALVFVTRSFGL